VRAAGAAARASRPPICLSPPPHPLTVRGRDQAGEVPQDLPGGGHDGVARRARLLRVLERRRAVDELDRFVDGGAVRRRDRLLLHRHRGIAGGFQRVGDRLARGGGQRVDGHLGAVRVCVAGRGWRALWWLPAGPAEPRHGGLQAHPVPERGRAHRRLERGEGVLGPLQEPRARVVVVDGVVHDVGRGGRLERGLRAARTRDAACVGRDG
jgi:hypothetical protein